MAKKTRIEDIDSEAVINSFRLDDTSIPPEARSTGGNAPSPPPKEELQTVITSPASRPKEEPERKRRNGKPEKHVDRGCEACRIGSNVVLPTPSDVSEAVSTDVAEVDFLVAPERFHRLNFPPNAPPRGPPSFLVSFAV